MSAEACVIVVPCYNEAARLDVDAFTAFARHDSTCRFVFVDDGSRDATAEVLSRLCETAPDRFRMMAMGKNCGKAEAVRQGVLSAMDRSARFVGYWDADLATPLDAIASLRQVLEERPEVRIVLGSRVRLLGRRIERRAARHYMGRLFATAASLARRPDEARCQANRAWRAAMWAGPTPQQPPTMRAPAAIQRSAKATYASGVTSWRRSWSVALAPPSPTTNALA